MSRQKKQYTYGIKQVSFYDRSTLLPFGEIVVLGGSTLAFAGNIETLTGGSNPFIYAAEDGLIEPSLNLKIKEMPDFLFKLLMGSEPVTTEAEAANITGLTNKKGTSVQKADTGIVSVTIKTGSEADLKYSRFIIKAVSATTVDVYAMTSSDFQKGTNKLKYFDDELKITETPLLIETDTPVEILGTGVELTGGTGVIGMTTGDTAYFDVNPASAYRLETVLGRTGDTAPEFGVVAASQTQRDGTVWLFDCFRVAALGLPFGLEERKFGEYEISAKLVYDINQDGVCKIQRINPNA